MPFYLLNGGNMRKEDFVFHSYKDYVFIESDNLFICQRLQQIDPSYRVVFNLKKRKYEVHSVEQFGGSYCFTLPFENLDERAVDFALKTRRENSDKIIAEIDKYNEKLYNQMLKQEVNKLKEALC